MIRLFRRVSPTLLALDFAIFKVELYFYHLMKTSHEAMIVGVAVGVLVVLFGFRIRFTYKLNHFFVIIKIH